MVPLDAMAVSGLSEIMGQSRGEFGTFGEAKGCSERWEALQCSQEPPKEPLETLIRCLSSLNLRRCGTAPGEGAT